VLPDVENMGIAVGISLIRTEAEICVISYLYFRLMAAIFDLSPIHTSGILRSTSVVLPDLENIGIAVGISLVSCMEAEIYVISYLLPVNGSHLCFLPYSHV